MNLKKYPLSDGQWFAEPQVKRWIVWHGTQGRTAFTPSNGQPGQATTSIDGWNQNEGHIGTPFVVDRDGTIFTTFEDEREWIYHLGLKGTNGKYDRASIGIEFANELELIPANGKFYAFGRIHRNTEYLGPRLQRTWRAHDWWAKLDEAQVDAAIELTLELCVKHGIPKTFFYPSTAYDYPRCFEVAGILCHANCREDKSDMILEDWVWAKLQAAGFQLIGAQGPIVEGPTSPGVFEPITPPEPEVPVLPDFPEIPPRAIIVLEALAPLLGDLNRYSPDFLRLVHLYRQSPIQFRGLKAVTLAQWIHESDRGRNDFGMKFRNFAGLRWPGNLTMAGWATPEPYADPAGDPDHYCSFPDLAHFILGYWHFLDGEAYDGWEAVAHDPEAFIRHIVAKGFEPRPDYADLRILPLLPEAQALLDELPLEIALGGVIAVPPDIGKGSPLLDGLSPYTVRFYKGDYRQRQEAANEDGCVAYVEQHFNSGTTHGYSVVVTATNASQTSKEWGRAYAAAVAEEFGCQVGGEDGIAIGGFNGRGNGNLYYTQMPAILLEPLFASDPKQAAIIRSRAGQDRLARILGATIRRFFPDGGLVAFSVGHKYKTSSPNDCGVDVIGGGWEADFAELVLQKAEKLLVGAAGGSPAIICDVPSGVVATARVKETRDHFLAVRDAPEQRAKLLDKIPSGTVVGIHGERGIWRKISQHEERWVSGTFLIFGDPVEKERNPLAAPVGTFVNTLAKVFNRGNKRLPGFLQELVAWGKTAPDVVFADQPGNEKDIYASIVAELGPFEDLIHRKACLLEVMRVLAGFESSWNWNQGIDTQNAAENSADTISAGAFQVSANSLAFGSDLKALVAPYGIRSAKRDGDEFQRLMKADHPLAMDYIARLIRHTRMHHGPLHRGNERTKFKPSLRGPEQSIYQWLSRDAVAEFRKLLS